MTEKCCCELFSYYLNYTCEIHPDRRDCPDVVLIQLKTRFGIPLHDGTHRWVPIRYCPWCGKQIGKCAADSEKPCAVRLHIRRRFSAAACCRTMDDALHPFLHSGEYAAPQSLMVQGVYDSGISVLDGGRSYIRIRYCPWCGARQRDVPEMLRIRWGE